MKGHFDKILLAVLLVIGIAAHEHMTHSSVDLPSISWMENICAQLLAALLTLMVGNRMAMRNGDGNLNGGSSSEKPKVLPSVPVVVAGTITKPGV